MAYKLYIYFSIQEFITECIKTKQIKKMYFIGYHNILYLHKLQLKWNVVIITNIHNNDIELKILVFIQFITLKNT